MRLEWQCPICYAQIGDKSHARMVTCPFCGTLLIVDSKNKKFYPVKKGRGWYYFPRIYLKGYDGIVKLGDSDLLFKYVNGQWHLHFGNGIYNLVNRQEECKYGDEKDVVEIWGDISMIIVPEQSVKIGYWREGICVKTSKESYTFLKIY